MVPESFHDFFLAEAGASGALIGLLFVAISVRPERVVGERSLIVEQTRASSALTALVTPLTLALVALIPGANVAVPAAIAGVAGLLFVAATLRRFFSVKKPDRESPRGLIGLVGFTAVDLVILGYAIAGFVSPDPHTTTTAFAAASIASTLIGVDRAWALIGARERGRAASLIDLVKGEPGDDNAKL